MQNPEPCVLVIFGASGDLTSRKLVPAMYEMLRDDHLPAEFCILGIARRPKTDEQWREELEPWVREHDPDMDEATWKALAEKIYYQAADATTSQGMEDVSRRIGQLDAEQKTGGNILFFLSVASALYEPIVEQISAAGLVTEGKRWCSIDPSARSWQRIIVEKPFGHDEESAKVLNRALGRAFEEEGIYRIDHYLAKEVVQSLLVFRFANVIWEPIWNHRYIDHVQISATEDVGVGQRSEFYDQTGAIRDMIQSHLMQVMAFVAMEPPTDYTPEHVRAEKIKVVDALEVPPSNAIEKYCALGQYGPSEHEPGYSALEGVAKGSTTETFAAMKLRFENWRWAETPFYVRSGKRLGAKRTEIVVQFKPPAANLFRKLPGFKHEPNLVPNRIVMEIAPRETFAIRFETKRPGQGITLDTLEMVADVEDRFDVPVVEAYGPLIVDAMRGDQTLFKHRVEVERAWGAVMPFLGPDSQAARENIADNYTPGSWGPDSSDALMARDGRVWKND